MNISQCEFCGEADKQEMMALVHAFPAGSLHVVDMPYRFSSLAFDDPQNVGLWVNAQGQLSAWAVMQTPFWTIDYACHPDAERSLHRQILDWADNRARQMCGTPDGRPFWFVNVFTDKVERIRDLETAGFACQADVGEDSLSKVLMERPGQEVVKHYAPPAGFIVRPLAGESEVEAYVELHRSVFESKSMTAEWRRRTLHHPSYLPELDVVVAAPDGRLAAFCICWLHKNPGEAPMGRVEPLGCHKDFRRYALGRVALAEGLRRLQNCGVEKIHVETDSYRNTAFDLYEFMGFRVVKDVLVYRKDYS